jgi:ABC-type sugar transport system permease subunit
LVTGGFDGCFLAGLQGIPDIYYEAAEIDGAGRWEKLWNITIPLMSPIIFFNLVIGFINSFQVFANTFLITRGGPENATLFLTLYIYRTGITSLHMGYAATLSWVFLYPDGAVVPGLPLFGRRLLWRVNNEVITMVVSTNLCETQVARSFTRRRSAPGRSRVLQGLIVVLLVIIAIIMLMPLLWLLSSSLKPLNRIFASPPEWIPNPVRLENFSEALTIRPFGLYLVNTLKIVVLNVIAVVFSSSFVAYGFARLPFQAAISGSDCLATLFLPIRYHHSQFLILSRLGWIDSS